MAINADQLLNRPSELHRRYGGRLAMQKAQQEKMVGGGPSNIVLSKKSIKGIEGIKINVIKIEDIFKGSLALDKKQLDDKKKATSRKRKDDIETKLETKPNVESGGKVKLPTAPRMGILDFVKNFIGNVLLGYFAVRLIKHLPKIMPIVKFLGNAADFIIDVGGKLLNGLVTFVQKGQEAHDKTRGFIKNLGGENFAKVFDKFLGAIDTALFLTTVLAGSMALEAMSGGGGPGRGGPGGGKPGGKPNVINKGFWNERTGRWQGSFRGKGGEYRTNEAARRYTQRFGRDAATSRFGKEGLDTLGGKYARSGVTNLARKGLVGLAGKGGAKMILGVVRPLLKRLPIIGALIDFGLSVALGEDPGRAAFKAIGAGLLGTVGAAIGSLAFGFGGIVGGILGSIGGDALGGALYDTFFGGKKSPQKGKVQGKAGGGITRGGKSAGGVKRTVSKGKYKRVLTPQKPSKTELKTEAFTKPENKTLKESTEELDKTKYFGPILAISSKIMNKEEPTDRDYQNVGLGINMLIAKGIQEKQLKGGIVAAFAEGGLVDPDVLSAAETGGDISNWVAKTFRGEIESNAQKTLRMIRENAEKKKTETTETPPSPEIEMETMTTGGGTADTSLNPHRRAFLDTLAYAEGTANYPNTGYNTMFTGKQFAEYKDHPRKIQVSGRYRSDAAGRYQFLSTTWDGLGLSDFSPANQDRGALKLLAPHVITAIDKGDFATAFHGARKTWASLPGAGYGQPEKKMKTLVSYANSRLEKYQKGQIGKPVDEPIEGLGSLPGGVTSQQIKTGPSQYIGGSTAYHIDTKFHKSLGMGNMVSSMDKLANAYSARGRKIEFSNAGVSGEVYNPKASSKEKQSLLQRAIDAHSHSRFMRAEGFLPFDYYNPKKNENRFGKSVEGSEILLPTFGGKVDVGTKYGGYGKSAEIFSGNKMVAMTGHGDVRYEKGGETLDGPHLAMVGEKGREIVIDNDSVESHPEVRQMLLAINQASNYQGVLNAIRQYAPYDAMSPQTIIVPTQGGDENEYDSGMSGGVALMPIGGGDSYDPFDALVMGS